MTTNTRIPLSTRCDAVIGAHALLRHPFYQAWSDGTLPVAALRDYAREYGAFIGTIGAGWDAIGEPRIAGIEEGHASVWRRTFAAGLETAVAEPQVPEVAQLVALSEALFAAPVTALGALYAFEAQQPKTAQSKLAGLRAHYTALPAACGEYFRLHEHDDAEPALLAEKLDGLGPAEQAEALAACERMSRALYDALSGVYARYAAACN